MRGSRAPTGAGAEAPHPVTVLADRSISGNSAGDRRRDTAHRRAFRRSAAAFSLRRRAALSTALFTLPSASSWQEAIVPPGGAPPPPEYEGANLARGRRTSTRPGIAGR